MPIQTNTTNIANTIALQLGGTGRLSAMVGAHNFLDHGDALSFKFKGSRVASYCKIKLDAGTDTYTVTLAKIRKYELHKAQVFDLVYADGLRELFERVTGLYLSLGTMGR
jgi:hypothetical protein